jgi:hypothetical protein
VNLYLPPFCSSREFANLDLHETARVSSLKAVSCEESYHVIAVTSSLLRLGVEVIVATPWQSIHLCFQRWHIILAMCLLRQLLAE